MSLHSSTKLVSYMWNFLHVELSKSRMKSIFDSGYRQREERSVHIVAICRIISICAFLFVDQIIAVQFWAVYVVYWHSCFTQFMSVKYFNGVISLIVINSLTRLH